MIRVLRRRDFGLLWLATLISLTGDWSLMVALPVTVYTLTGSALSTSLMFMAGFLPSVLFGTVAGVFVDRWERRTTLVLANLLLALGLLPLLIVHSASMLWIVYLVQLFEASVAQFVIAARGALLPELVPTGDLPAANALSSFGSDGARLVGPALGGIVVGLSGLGGVVVFDSLTFLVPALLLLGVRASRGPAPAVVSTGTLTALYADWRSGVATVLASPALRALFGLVALTGVGEGIFSVLFVVFVRLVLHGGALQLGWLLTAQAIGGVVGGLLVAAWPSRWRPVTMVWAGSVLFGLIDLVIVNEPLLLSSVPITAALIVAVGLPGALWSVGVQTLTMTSADDRSRGRVFGARGTVVALMTLVGMAIAGTLGDRVGPIPLLNFQGALYVIGGLMILLVAGTAFRASAAPEPGRAESRTSG
jgi:MFS family permease